MKNERNKYIVKKERIVSLIRNKDIVAYEKENKCVVAALSDIDYMKFVESAKEKKKILMYC